MVKSGRLDFDRISLLSTFTFLFVCLSASCVCQVLAYLRKFVRSTVVV